MYFLTYYLFILNYFCKNGIAKEFTKLLSNLINHKKHLYYTLNEFYIKLRSLTTIFKFRNYIK